ncbi:type II toxin-antitoxin system RelE/ParE family toxin [Vitreimonas sp.]|uniref:type II toxin-antitoxin system RelE/ParE family toxin n=1 Tax=Vitreimonas sp. TaxID=3069702 RepID=UPI0039C95B11
MALYGHSLERGASRKYLQDIFRTIEALAQEPSSGRACGDIRPGYFRRNVGSHAIFFRVVGTRVEIVRVLHARRDFQRHLARK